MRDGGWSWGGSWFGIRNKDERDEGNRVVVLKDAWFDWIKRFSGEGELEGRGGRREEAHLGGFRGGVRLRVWRKGDERGTKPRDEEDGRVGREERGFEDLLSFVDREEISLCILGIALKVLDGKEFVFSRPGDAFLLPFLFPFL